MSANKNIGDIILKALDRAAPARAAFLDAACGAITNKMWIWDLRAGHFKDGLQEHTVATPDSLVALRASGRFVTSWLARASFWALRGRVRLRGRRAVSLAHSGFADYRCHPSLFRSSRQPWPAHEQHELQQ